MSDFLKSAVGEVGDFLKFVILNLKDEEAKRATLLDLGLDPNEVPDTEINEPPTTSIEQYQNAINPDVAAYKSAINDLSALYKAIKDLIKTLIKDPLDWDKYLWISKYHA